jgi:membrane protein involved in colicin uptake
MVHSIDQGNLVAKQATDAAVAMESAQALAEAKRKNEAAILATASKEASAQRRRSALNAIESGGLDGGLGGGLSGGVGGGLGGGLSGGVGGGVRGGDGRSGASEMSDVSARLNDIDVIG